MRALGERQNEGDFRVWDSLSMHWYGNMTLETLETCNPSDVQIGRTLLHRRNTNLT